MLGNGTTIQLVFLWRRQDCSSLHDHCIAGHPNKLRVGRFCSAQASGHPSHLPRSGQPSPGNRRGGESICRLCITVLTLHCRSLATPLNVTYRDISRQACLCSRHRSPGETTSEAQWRSAVVNCGRATSSLDPLHGAEGFKLAVRVRREPHRQGSNQHAGQNTAEYSANCSRSLRERCTHLSLGCLDTRSPTGAHSGIFC